MTYQNTVTSFVREKIKSNIYYIIWRAVKRETKVKNPSLTGEALLTAKGRRFRDVINYTQVYDSVNTLIILRKNKIKYFYNKNP